MEKYEKKPRNQKFNIRIDEMSYIFVTALTLVSKKTIEETLSNLLCDYADLLIGKVEEAIKSENETPAGGGGWDSNH